MFNDNVKDLISNLKYILIHNKEKLLKKQYLNLNNCDEMTGHCYVASEVFYHLYGKYHGFEPKVVSNKHIEKDISKQWTHWYLQNRQTLEIIDLTATQFSKTCLDFCYTNGVFKGFLTKEPSRRSQFVINILKLHKN